MGPPGIWLAKSSTLRVLGSGDPLIDWPEKTLVCGGESATGDQQGASQGASQESNSVTLDVSLPHKVLVGRGQLHPPLKNAVVDYQGPPAVGRSVCALQKCEVGPGHTATSNMPH